MRSTTIVLALLLVASAPLALAAETTVMADAESQETSECGGPVCQALCFVLTRLHRPCLRVFF